jgi:ketosteroid isomerase-like protein
MVYQFGVVSLMVLSVLASITSSDESCKAHSDGLQDLQDVIAAQNVKFETAYNSKDLQGLSQLYTEDCKLMPTGTAVKIGRQGIIDVFGANINAGAVSVKLDIQEVGPFSNTSTEYIYERSSYTFKDSSGNIVDYGKYVVIWKMIGGVYYLHIDIFNTDKS